jgi:hypothetical protein
MLSFPLDLSGGEATQSSSIPFVDNNFFSIYGNDYSSGDGVGESQASATTIPRPAAALSSPQSSDGTPVGTSAGDADSTLKWVTVAGIVVSVILAFAIINKKSS